MKEDEGEEERSPEQWRLRASFKTLKVFFLAAIVLPLGIWVDSIAGGVKD